MDSRGLVRSPPAVTHTRLIQLKENSAELLLNPGISSQSVVVSFDADQVGIKDLVEAINAKTGYKAPLP